MKDESGQVGGLEGLVFGVLVFVFGTLVVVNAWQVVDAKFAAASAAREAARSYVEAPDATTADGDAATAARDAITGQGRAADRMTLTMLEGSFARCARVTMEVRYRAPFLRVPVLGAFGSGLTVSARHSELVDPLRSGLGGEEARCAGS
ncbi:MAG: hypothetical protein LC792_17480 [Actinobacteria bacterium]|nr:hypothetical protein [Actinomycetota bacterium]